MQSGPPNAAEDVSALFDRACHLDRLGQEQAARTAYLDVLTHHPGHAGALSNLGALLLASGFTSAARTVYQQAVAAHPADPAARVNLGNLLRQADLPHLALTQYHAALALDPACPEAHQGLSYLLDETDPAQSETHRTLGFSGRPAVTSIYRGCARPITVLQLVSARGGNIPTRQILDERVFLTHTVFAEYATALPPHDVVFNAIGDADRGARALDTAEALLTRTEAPVLNPPAIVRATSRQETARHLAGIPGLIVPHIQLLARDMVEATLQAADHWPILLRAPGYHTGQHFHRVEQPGHLQAALATLPGSHVMAITALDAQGPDGFWRKYRAMLIGDDILPLHLAIGPDWKLHYYTAGMQDRPVHQAEEARYLSDMPAVLGPSAMTALAAIKARLGLHYGGIDFGLSPDRQIMLFEANPAMTIVVPPDRPDTAHRRPAAQRALQTAQRLIRHAAKR